VFAVELPVARPEHLTIRAKMVLDQRVAGPGGL
jgi:hypothetical protein